MATTEIPPDMDNEEVFNLPDLLTREQHAAASVTLFALALVGTIVCTMNFRMLLSNSDCRNKAGPFFFVLVLTDLCICVFETPFAAFSHHIGFWFFGDTICQTYAFGGMFLAIINVFMVTLISLDRCWTTCSPLEAEMKFKNYPWMIVIGSLIGLFWAAAPLPLFGWSRYSIEPSGVSCHIDYMTNDRSYATYMAAMIIVCFFIPIGIMVYSYRKASANIKINSKVTGWADEFNVTQISAMCLFQVLFCWGLYVFIWTWTALAEDAETLPKMLTILAPILAKSSPLLNSWIYFFQNKQFRGAVADMFKAKEE